MNLLLLDPESDDLGPGRAEVVGERVRHVRKVLRKGPGDRLRIGIVGGAMGEGRIEALAPGRLVVAWTSLDEPPPPKRPLTLLFALCRPPMVQRILQTAAGFGVAEVAYFPAARTEASYLQSKTLSDRAIRRALLLGLAQARDTRLPPVRRLSSFEAAVEAVAAGPPRRLVGRAGAAPCPCGGGEPTILVVGPEGGFLDREEARLAEAGARPVGLGPWVLRTDTAVAALLGRLA